MLKNLSKLGFTRKESQLYLSLLEYGNQPASVIAKKSNIPRPTVLHILNKLEQKGYVHKSLRGRTQFFEGIKLHAICEQTKMHKTFQKKNKEQLRTIKMYQPKIGKLYSSIAVFEDKILLLNI